MTTQPLPQQSIPQTPSPIEPPDEESKKSLWLTFIAIVVTAGAVIFLLVFILLYFLPKATNTQTPGISPTPSPKQHATIQGTIVFEGYASDEMYIAITEKSDNSTNFKDVVSGIVPTKGTIPWTWSDAKQGVNYEIKATLKKRGKIVEESPIVDISAPATNVTLPIVSEQQPPTPIPAAISGVVNTDGYIPPGSFINISSQEIGSTAINQIANNLQPGDSVSWNWQNGETGKTYIIKSTLQDPSGITLASNQTTVTAPTSNLYAVLASKAIPPKVSPTGLSGTIIINGNIPNNSYVTLGVRPTGQSSFNEVATNINATSGVSWSWDGASTGTSYDVQAYLWSNNQPYSQSNILTVTAPSDNDILTINAQQATSAPGGNTINVNCNNQQNGNFQITLNYNTQANLSNPVSYNLVVTLASSGTPVLNTIVTPTNPTQPQSLTSTYIITSGATYFAQYAYNTINGGPFSSLSPYYQFSCH